MCEGIKTLFLRIRFSLRLFPPQKKKKEEVALELKENQYKGCRLGLSENVSHLIWKKYAAFCAFGKAMNVLLEFWPYVENMSGKNLS